MLAMQGEVKRMPDDKALFPANLRPMLPTGHIPVAMGGALPPVAVLLRWLDRIRREGVKEATMAAVPHDNASLPTVLRLGGITRLALLQSLPCSQFRWEGCGGGRITVQFDPGERGDTGSLPVHHGALPVGVDAHVGRDWTESIDTARMADALALSGHGTGASWEIILDGAASDPIAMPEHLGVWNPLPIPRLCVAAMPWQGKAPAAFCDERGARFPAQAVGNRVLTAVPLGAFEARGLAASDQTASGALWEVSPQVIDNGRVRAEFDLHGRVARLCFDGEFAEPAFPLVTPATSSGVVLDGPAQVWVRESGPVRAVVEVDRTFSDGRLVIAYSLHAHESVLRVSARWDGAGAIVLDHPTVYLGGELIVAGELAARRVPQAASVFAAQPQPQLGCRWATIGEPGGRGLAVLAAEPMTVAAHAGHLRVHLGSGVRYALGDALGDARIRPGAAGLGQAAMALAAAHPTPFADDCGPAFRLVDAGDAVPLWARRPPGWNGELVVSEQAGRRARAYFQPLPSAAKAWKVDAGGNPLAELTRADSGGFALELAAHELAIVRWR